MTAPALTGTADTTVELNGTLTPVLARAASSFAAALGSARTVAVAFSGGVDSSVTAALAARTLGPDHVTAILGVSPSLAAKERQQAATTAATIGVTLVEVQTHEMDDPRYVANAGDRCYFCKHELYTRAFEEALEATRSDLFVNGDTADDQMRTDRPGKQAALQLGVASPLAAAGIDKVTVRALAHHLRLPVWDKPSAPCLASRVPTHTPVTIEGLGRIERAESALHALGLRILRVRHHGETARVELGTAEHQLVAEQNLHAPLREAVQSAGYTSLDIDTRPLQRG